MTTSYIPGRKVLAGGTASVVTWAILTGFGYFAIPVPLELQMLLPSIVGYAISYLVPPAQQDLIRRIDNQLVAIAGDDPQSAVTREVGQAAKAVLYGR